MSEHEKVELEQVPLKSDVDPPAGTESSTPGAQPPEEDSFKKKTTTKWFFKKAKNGEVTTEASAEPDTVTAEKVSSPCRWWHRKQPKQRDGVDGAQMTVGVNLLDRDEKSLNSHVLLEFGELFAEPDSSHSWRWTWLAASRIYSCTSSIVYKLLAAVIAIPLALLFGVVCGICAAFNIFLCTPFGRLLSVPCNAIGKAWDFTVRRLLDPIFHSIGLCFSAFAARKVDLHNSPTVLA